MTDENLVFQSYGRCCAKAEFFDDFYRTFLASSPEVAEKFTHTDMVAQKQLLRAGILNLVLYARGLPPTKLQALAESTPATAWTSNPTCTAIGSMRCWIPSAVTIRKWTKRASAPGTAS